MADQAWIVFTQSIKLQSCCLLNRFDLHLEHAVTAKRKAFGPQLKE